MCSTSTITHQGLSKRFLFYVARLLAKYLAPTFTTRFFLGLAASHEVNGTYNLGYFSATVVVLLACVSYRCVSSRLSVLTHF